VRSNGDLEVANEQVSTQKAFTRLQVILNPTLSDIINSEDRYNAMKDWLEKDGVKDPDQFCTDPKIILQDQMRQMQQQMSQQAGQMQEEQKQAKQAQMSKQKADAEAKGAQEMADQLNQDSAQKLGEDLGNELFTGATQGTAQQ
jgi:hypothetical protein